MMDVFEKLFGTMAKVKIMRLFLFNPTENFDLKHISERCKVSSSQARVEISMLEKIGMIKKRSFFSDIVSRSSKKIQRKRVNGWGLDDGFQYLEPLRNLLAQDSPGRNKEILKRLSKAGKLKIVIISGFFIQNWDSRVDLLIVGDNLKKNILENTIKTIESEIGREIRYTSFETPDFQYRLGVYDKLIRDILDFPHEIILDKVGVPPFR